MTPNKLIRHSSLIKSELAELEKEWERLDSQGRMESEQQQVAERMESLAVELLVAEEREARTITGEG